MGMDTLLLIGKAALALFGATSALVLWGCAAMSGRLDDYEEVRGSAATRPLSS